MIRRFFSLSLPLAVLASACSAPETAPRADPATVDRLLAGFEARAPAAAKVQSRASIEKKIESADRLAENLVKVEPDRVDPDLAATLITR